MCRFVAFISSENIPAGPFLEELKRQAREGKRAPHLDGFGYWILGEKEHIMKTTLPAWEFSGEVPRGRIGMLHARKRGERGAAVELRNVHPFQHRGAVFMHNGLVEVERHPCAAGDTDTESFFLNLLEHGVEEEIRRVSRGDYASMNFVMWKDGKLFIFRTARKLQDYFSIWIKRGDPVVISTERFGVGEWEEVRNGEMWLIGENLEIETRCIFQDTCR